MSHLKSLYLKNFVLIKEALVDFHQGFHAISGETGSGKTMILEALSLILGEKADLSVIRKGEEKALIEAEFIIEEGSILFSILKQLHFNIEFNILKISREIGKNKNKAWIGSESATLTDLKKLAPYVGEIIHSHSQLLLQDPIYQKNILDTYASLKDLVKKHETLYQEHQELLLEKHNLLELQKEGSVYAKLWEEILKEIGSLKISSEEKEKELFTAYTALIDQKESFEIGRKLVHELSESPQSILSKLSKCQKDLHKLALQPELRSLDNLATEAHDHLSNISFKLSGYLESFEEAFASLETIEKDLSQIKLIKKKYGPTFSDIETYKKLVGKKLLDFRDIETHLKDLEKKLSNISKDRQLVAKELSSKRASAAQSLASSIESYLPFLNLSGTRFFIAVTKALPSNDGEDEVNYLFQTEGSLEKRSLSLHASSGELARIFFILKLLLQNNQSKKILIFDEIDANIGGMTAGKLGELFKELGRNQQVIAITHFAQVAFHADHHLHIEKISKHNDISSLITLLDEASKKKELYRMVGGISLKHLTMQ